MVFDLSPRLTIYFQVETLLEQLDSKFDEMSSQILDRSIVYPFASHSACSHPFSGPDVYACRRA
jgi:hypothetical protein